VDVAQFLGHLMILYAMKMLFSIKYVKMICE